MSVRQILDGCMISGRWHVIAGLTSHLPDDEFGEIIKTWSASAQAAARASRQSRGASRVSANFKKVFTDKGFNKAVYKALTSRDRENVLTEGLKGYKENYLPKANTPARKSVV